MKENDLIRLWKIWSERYLKGFLNDTYSLEIKFGRNTTGSFSEYRFKVKYMEAEICFDHEQLETPEIAVYAFIHELCHHVTTCLNEIPRLIELTEHEEEIVEIKCEQAVVMMSRALIKLIPHINEVPKDYYYD